MDKHTQTHQDHEKAYWIECPDCKIATPFSPLHGYCPSCKCEWRFARYDLERVKASLTQDLSARDQNIWRYAELLPIERTSYKNLFNVGWTPLLHAEQLGLLLGLNRLFIKDERQGPTRSFKDRQAAISTAVFEDHKLSEVVICSTGNVALAFSASCARAGIKLWGFLTSLVPPEKMHEVAVYGTRVIKVTGTHDEAKQLAHTFAKQRKLYLDRGVKSIAAVESMKTIAFEIAEQLPASLDPGNHVGWSSPHWYIQAVSGGLGPIGVLKGFQELQQLDLIEKPPAMAIIQAEGCAPMVRAWKAGKKYAQPVKDPKTHITTLTTGDPGPAYTFLQQQLREVTGGTMESVTDEETFQALHLLAKLEGISVEPAAAAAFAGVIKLAKEGVFQRDEVIVVNCSGHAMPVQPSLLSPGWSLDIQAPLEDSLPDQPSEGLVSALRSLNEKIASSILIIDDHADARRLIRRVLESQGSYTINEAGSGEDALRTIASERPDVIILDLMMPEMDGFRVLDELKQNMEEGDIPVIVVTAKELSASEQKKLEGQIKGLLVKGDFLGDDLVNHVENLLE